MRGGEHLLILLTFWIVYWTTCLIIWYETKFKEVIDLRFVLLIGGIFCLSYITSAIIHSIIKQSLVWSLRFIGLRYRIRRLKRRLLWTFTKKLTYEVKRKAEHRPYEGEGITRVVEPVPVMHDTAPLPVIQNEMQDIYDVD